MPLQPLCKAVFTKDKGCTSKNVLFSKFTATLEVYVYAMLARDHSYSVTHISWTFPERPIVSETISNIVSEQVSQFMIWYLLREYVR